MATRTPTIEEVLFGDVPTVKKRQVAKLKVEGNLQASTVFISTEYDERDLTVTLTDCERAWNGHLTHPQLTELANKASIEQVEYNKLMLNALNGTNETPTICSVTLRGNNVKLSWKKVLKDGVRFELGSMTLSCQDCVEEVHSSLLEHLVERVDCLQSDMSRLREGHAQLENEHKHALAKLEENVQLKETIEKNLYGKFLLILNSKKAKIRHLLENKSKESIDEEEDASSPEGQSLPSEEREESPPSPKRVAVTTAPGPKGVATTTAPGPVKRRKRVSTNRSHVVPQPPPVIETRRRSRAPSEGDTTIESDELLKLL